MTERRYQIGDLVILTCSEWKGFTGVVSWPVEPEKEGYVLVCSETRIAGLRVSGQDIRAADESGHGFTQLAYLLLKLSSQVIENSILPGYRIEQ